MAVNRNQVVLTANRATDQVFSSVYSKKGRTSLTGVFEGVPQNVVTKTRGYTVPQGPPDRTSLPLDTTFDKYNPTYVEYMRNAKRK